MVWKHVQMRSVHVECNKCFLCGVLTCRCERRSINMLNANLYDYNSRYLQPLTPSRFSFSGIQPQCDLLVLMQN